MAVYSNILKVTSRTEFRQWLINHSTTEKECWVTVKRGAPSIDGVFYYIDAVEEALCFGWIDSTVRNIEGVVMQRFSPRRKNSHWTSLNKERVRRLEKMGLMTDAGRAVLPEMNIDQFKMDEDLEDALKKAGVWTQFQEFHPLYKRIRTHNVLFARKRSCEAYHKALAHLIEKTRKGKMYGEWNDYGRLLDY